MAACLIGTLTFYHAACLYALPYTYTFCSQTCHVEPPYVAYSWNQSFFITLIPLHLPLPLPYHSVYLCISVLLTSAELWRVSTLKQARDWTMCEFYVLVLSVQSLLHQSFTLRWQTTSVTVTHFSFHALLTLLSISTWNTLNIAVQL